MADAVDEDVPPDVLDNVLGWIRRNLVALPEDGHETFRNLASRAAHTLERLKQVYQRIQHASREVVARARATARDAVIRLLDFIQDKIGVVPTAIMARMANVNVHLYFPQVRLPPVSEPNVQGQGPTPQPPQGPPPQPPQEPPPQPPQRPQEAHLAPLLRFASHFLQFIWERRWWVLAGAVAGGMAAGVAVGTTGGLPAAAAAGATVGPPVAVATGAMGSPNAVAVGAAVGAAVGVPSAMAVHGALRPHGAVAAAAAVGPRSAVAAGAAIGLPVVAVAVGAAVGLPVIAGIAAGAAVGGAAGLAIKVAKDYFLGRPHEHQD